MAVQKVTRRPDYSDLDLDFIANGVTGDIVRKEGVDAIKRSIRNLILTNFYDRPFQSYIGSNVQKLLFENIMPLTATFLKDAIVEVITNFEPRVELINDINNGVRIDPDEDNNGYNVTLSFIIINRGEPATINIFLERIR